MAQPKETGGYGLQHIGRKKDVGAAREFYGGNHTYLDLPHGHGRVPWVEAADFPITDPWTTHTRHVLGIIQRQGGFQGDFLEAGIGDGRNVVAAGVHRSDAKIRGIDIDGWRGELAGHNLRTTLGIPDSRLDLQIGDVVSYLNGLSGERLTGWGVACLPQAPGIETSNDADGYDANMPSLGKVKETMKLKGHPVDEVGWTLNAAFLQALRRRVDPRDFNLTLTLSHRVPPEFREELFAQTGWKMVKEYPTDTPIQQDPDTGIHYVNAFDDGQRFSERNPDGTYTFISATEAERRRVLSANNGGRDSLNVYHGLSVIHLQPDDIQVYATRN